jgi:hypothetical protein
MKSLRSRMVSRIRLVLAQILAHGRARLRFMRLSTFDCYQRKCCNRTSREKGHPRKRRRLVVQIGFLPRLISSVVGGNHDGVAKSKKLAARNNNSSVLVFSRRRPSRLLSFPVRREISISASRQERAGARQVRPHVFIRGRSSLGLGQALDKSRLPGRSSRLRCPSFI